MSRPSRARTLLVAGVLLGALAGAPAPASASPGASPWAAPPVSAGAPEEGAVLSTVLGTREVRTGPATRTAAPATREAPAVPRAVAAPVPRSAGDRRATAAWGWPLTGTPEVVHGFDPPAQRWLPGHRGIDLAGVAGEPVLAVEAGVVVFSGSVAGVGVVSVDHASGLRSTYQPVTDPVPRGTRVGRGDRLGRLGTGGHCVLRDCLHLGARRGRHTYVDPEPLLRPLTLSLLPLEHGHGGP